MWMRSSTVSSVPILPVRNPPLALPGTPREIFHHISVSY
jgi:hypothetical protein